MKILVPIKRVIDHTVKVRINSENSGIETNNVKMTINPFDAHALEEAVRLKETGKAREIIVVTIGTEKAQEQLRTALAMGADRAILVKSSLPIDIGGVQSLDVAKTFYRIANIEQPDLILMGKQSIDSDAGQTPQMLAALLGWPQSTNTSSITLLEEGDEQIEVAREVDGGVETLRLKMPAVISADLQLNKPRYAKLPDIMKAKNKPLEIIDLQQTNSNIELLKITEPPKRAPGITVPDVNTLIDKLRYEAKVI
jgi:electron transfer flavoprotein beta subunit